MKTKPALCTVSALVLSASLVSGTVFGFPAQTDSQNIDPGKILKEIKEQAGEKAESIRIPDFEGTICVAASDGMRNAIADHYRSEDDMSWIDSAELSLRGTSNETGGADLEAAFLFNDTELYHLQASYDRGSNDLYLVCPELKEEVLVFPIGDFRADAQTITGRKITPEMIADYTSALKELNDLVRSISLESLKREADKYVSVLSNYLTVENGVTKITSGSLSEEANTITWTLTRDAAREMVPEVLKLLSGDAFVQRILESPFAEHVFRLFVKNKALKYLPHGALWTLAKQALVNASEKEYKMKGDVSVTIALNRNQIPVHLSASMEQGGITAQLFQINAIIDGADHAFEVKVGPALAKEAGFRTRMSSGLLLQGSLKDDILRETLSASIDGDAFPVLRVQGLDLLELENMWLKGNAALAVNGTEYSCDFYTDGDGIRSMAFAVNGQEWFVLTADLHEVEKAEVDLPDLADAFVVDSRKAFFRYMRDASALRMFEKLSSAGVPKEYVEMLTDGEAATESSRENTEELGEEEG